MSDNKTQPTIISPAEFIAAVEPDRRRKEGEILLELFEKTTGWKPKMWGPSIIGFGEYHYKYETGREGDFMATGFSPRKAKLSIYIMPGYSDYGSIMQRLGKHSVGKSCLYINKLDDIDLDVLTELIETGVKDLSKKYPVKSS